MAASKGSQSRIFWGIVLIAIGVMFLLDQMGELTSAEFGAVARAVSDRLSVAMAA